MRCNVSEQWGCASSESFLPSADGYFADDEVSLCKLGGFALFSCIHLLKRKLMWKRSYLSVKKNCPCRAYFVEATGRVTSVICQQQYMITTVAK